MIKTIKKKVFAKSYMSMLIQVVVGQFDFLKGYFVLHPLRTGSRRILVYEISVKKYKQSDVIPYIDKTQAINVL